MANAKLAKKVILPRFTLTETCIETDAGAIKRTIPAVGERPALTYFVRSTEMRTPVETIPSPRSVQPEYNLFPVVTDKLGGPWDVAVAYILSRLQGQSAPNMNTYYGIADDLGAFKDFLEEYEIDFTHFPQYKLKRPTYRFHGYLKNQIFDGRIAASTAKRRMAAVIAFYRWLIVEKLLFPDFPLWQERDHHLTFKDGPGFSAGMTVKSTDVSIRTAQQIDPFDSTICDGEKLRPLPINEQKWLIEALAHLANPEMILIHAFIMATGARIQTVLTMRVRHAQFELPHDVPELRLPVGAGTGIDTKYDKLMTLHIPRWLYERLRVYSLSERARKRRGKAVGGDSKEQYLFLTQQGRPYYQSKSEMLTFLPSMQVRHQKKGQTVRVFIAEHVLPYIRGRYDPNFHYQLHDLRATFGMNMTDIQLALVEKKETTLARAREFVATRMGHKSGATTDLYLNYRQTMNMVHSAIDAHEQYYRELLERAWEGNLDAN